MRLYSFRTACQSFVSNILMIIQCFCKNTNTRLNNSSCISGWLLFRISYKVDQALWWYLKVHYVTIFVLNFHSLYYWVHQKSIFQKVFLSYPESPWSTYNKCLNSEYFWLGGTTTAAKLPSTCMTRYIDKLREEAPATIFFRKTHAVLFINS